MVHKTDTNWLDDSNIRLLRSQDFDMHNSQLLGNYNDYEGHEENFQITFLRLLQYSSLCFNPGGKKYKT